MRLQKRSLKCQAPAFCPGTFGSSPSGIRGNFIFQYFGPFRQYHAAPRYFYGKGPAVSRHVPVYFIIVLEEPHDIVHGVTQGIGVQTAGNIAVIAEINADEAFLFFSKIRVGRSVHLQTGYVQFLAGG